MDYYVREHDGHFHVLHEDQEPVLDDRIENPWRFKYEATALDVARRLNEGETPYEVRHTLEDFASRHGDI